jgi:hypothetical protein
MQKVFMVIRDCGDGSQAIEWRKLWSDEILESLEADDSYQSGDGVQMSELQFPDTFDLDNWAFFNHITWADGSESEEF